MSTTFTPQIIGQTEKALNAILDRHLANTGVSEPQWVTLTLAVMSGGSIPRDVLLGRVAHALKVSDDVALRHVAALQAAGLIDPGEGPTVTVSEAGEQFHRQIRTVNAELTQRLWGDLPIEDLDTAGRVLETILGRANEELAGGQE
jgi:DNA-binding MarR family transcriptional regulator